MQPTHTFSVPTLDRNSYHQWHQALTVTATALQLDQFLTSDIADPVDPAQATSHRIKKAQITWLIMNSMPEDIRRELDPNFCPVPIRDLRKSQSESKPKYAR